MENAETIAKIACISVAIILAIVLIGGAIVLIKTFIEDFKD